MSKRTRPRDPRKWRIPRPGTISHEIYMMATQGKKPVEIACALGVDTNNVNVLLWRIRHPERSNQRQRDFYATK